MMCINLDDRNARVYFAWGLKKFRGRFAIKLKAAIAPAIENRITLEMLKQLIVLRLFFWIFQTFEGKFGYL
jgi:hypothetical protein